MTAGDRNPPEVSGQIVLAGQPFIAEAAEAYLSDLSTARLTFSVVMFTTTKRAAGYDARHARRGDNPAASMRNIHEYLLPDARFRVVFKQRLRGRPIPGNSRRRR
jgi:hypothetical protein